MDPSGLFEHITGISPLSIDREFVFLFIFILKVVQYNWNVKDLKNEIMTEFASCLLSKWYGWYICQAASKTKVVRILIPWEYVWTVYKQQINASDCPRNSTQSSSTETISAGVRNNNSNSSSNTYSINSSIINSNVASNGHSFSVNTEQSQILITKSDSILRDIWLGKVKVSDFDDQYLKQLGIFKVINEMTQYIPSRPPPRQKRKQCKIKIEDKFSDLCERFAKQNGNTDITAAEMDVLAYLYDEHQGDVDLCLSHMVNIAIVKY